MIKTFLDAKNDFKNWLVVRDCGYKTPCWCWKSPDKSRGNYGRVWFQNRCVSSHRFSWIIYRGKIPKGIEVCHHCDNATCVNPEHLFLGTHLENIRDAYSKKLIPPLKGELNGCCKLTSDDVIKIRELRFSENLKYEAIAKRFKVHQSTIFLIIKRKRWKHI